MELELKDYKIIFDSKLDYHLLNFLNSQKYNFNKIFVLTDKNVEQKVLPKIKILSDIPYFSIEPGEKSKNIDTVKKIWEFLLENKADRYSLLINLGGGVVSDIGGFAASTFKRGIDFINIPTTLLAQVDASVGGKTGVDFLGYKNIIGTFSNPKLVLIDTELLQTLPKRHFISGFAEMIKHSLIAGYSEWKKIKSFSLDDKIDYEFLMFLVKKSVEIKKEIVEKDPLEKGWRKVLNFGHTIGHGVETYLLNKGVDILHGEAVAIGLISEIYLSNLKFVFNIDMVFEISSYISSFFPAYTILYDDYQYIFDILLQDKKNKDGKVLFTLLKDLGKPVINQECSKSEIFEGLNFYYQFK